MSVQSKKKRDKDAFEHAGAVIRSLHQQALQGQCELLYFDGSGFSSNPPIQVQLVAHRESPLR